jgi:hypothetical protein
MVVTAHRDSLRCWRINCAAAVPESLNSPSSEDAVDVFRDTLSVGGDETYISVDPTDGAGFMEKRF